MRCKLIALLLLCATPALAQVDRTGEDNSYAQVDQASALVTYYDGAKADANWGGQAIFGVRVQNRYYSNATQPAYDGQLLPPATFTRSNDTLISEWDLSDCILKQIVYPFQTGDEYKIVTRYFATANVNQIEVEAQAIINTPRSFLTYQLPQKPPYGTYYDTVPGHTAYLAEPYLTEAYWRFPPHQVLRPRALMTGDLSALHAWLNWEMKVDRSSGGIYQFSTSVIWDSTSIADGNTKEIGSFIYGAAEFVECHDSISAKLFYPKRLITPADDLASRTLPCYVYFKYDQKNGYQSSGQKFSATLKASRGLTIAGLSLTDHPDSMLHVTMPFDARLPGWSVAFSTDLIADASIKSHITRDLDLGMDEVPNVGIAKNTTGCKYSIDLKPRKENDITAASIIEKTPLDCTTQIDTIVISDNTTAAEKGIKSITYQANNYAVRNLTAGILPSQSETLVVSVQDSLSDATILIRVIDGAEHPTVRLIEYCTTKDVLKPAVELATNSEGDWVVTIADDRPWDCRIGSIRLLDVHDIEFVKRTYSADSSRATYQIRPISTSSRFKLVATDRVGNMSDTIIASRSMAEVADGLENKVSAYLSGEILVITSRADTQVRVVDPMGRTIFHRSVRVGEETIDVSSLPSGRYYLQMDATLTQAFEIVR